MKKILFLINTLGVGGAERVLVDIVNNLDKNLFDITVQTIYDINYYKDELKPHIKYTSYFKYYNKGLFGKIYNKIAYQKVKRWSADKLYSNMVKDKYDIEVAFLEGLPTKIIAASSSKAKKIAWVHTDMYNNRESLGFFKNDNDEYNCYKKFDEIYTVSDKTTDNFKRRFKKMKKVYTIENIIDRQRINNLSKDKVDIMNEKNIFKIISVGRLEKIKGFDRLIETFYNLDATLKDKTHLYIIGDGSQKNLIDKKIKEYDLDKKVTLLGYQKNPYKYIKKANLYICPSYAEGYSLTIAESTTLGVPVLSTDCGISPDLLNDGKYGEIVENNTKSLTEKLESLINNPEIIKQYKKNLKKKTDFDKNTKKIESYLLGGVQ